MSEPISTMPPSLPPPPGEVEEPRIYLPGPNYLGRVLVRQLPLMIIIGLFTTTLAIVIGSRQKDHLASYVAAVYDDRDSAESVPRYPLYPRFAQVADTFRVKLGDPEFLWQVAAEVGLPTKESREERIWERLRHALALLPAMQRVFPERSAPDDEAALKNDNAERLRRAFELAPDDKKNVLALKVTTDDALQSKQLADAAMELFIQSELRFEAEAFRRQHEAFANFLHTLTTSAEAEQKEQSEKRKSAKDAGALTDQDRLREQETELVDKIQALRSEVDQDKSRAASLRAAIESDLARLTTKLQPSHPDVIAKQEELRGLGRDSSDSSLKAKIGQLRTKLTEVREQERKLGMRVILSEGREGDLSPQRGQFLPTLADRVKELSLEEVRMSRQVEAPALRTRLRLSMPATYDSTPPGKARRQTTVALVLLGLAFAFAAGLIREMRTPYARDLWRVVWRSRTALLAEVPSKAMRAYEGLAHSVILERDLSLSRNHQDQWAREAMQAYRRLEFELRQRCAGSIVLLQSASSSPAGAAFCSSFLNVVGSETAQPVLLIDCDSRHPVPSDGVPMLGGKGFADFLNGKATWKEVRLARSSTRAFDMVPAPTNGSGHIMRPDALQQILPGLTKTYGRILIRAGDLGQVLNTSSLLAIASDCVVLVDAQSATFAEVEAALRVTPSLKNRGLVMIGT